MTAILDASALLAFLQNEPGCDKNPGLRRISLEFGKLVNVRHPLEPFSDLDLQCRRERIDRDHQALLFARLQD